jgi:hypothetical protein
VVSDASDPVEFPTSSLLNLDLDGRRRTLEERLDDGYQRIDQAVLSGADVTEWESFWLRLLGEYEDVCRELDRAA